MIETIRQGLQAEGITVSIAKRCRWFGVPRRTVYYKPVKSAPKVDPKFATPIKAMIEESPSFGYRTVAHLLGLNKNTVQRVFQLMGWQVRKWPLGSGLGYRHCRLWLPVPTSAGRRTCAASGRVGMAGRRWRW